MHRTGRWPLTREQLAWAAAILTALALGLAFAAFASEVVERETSTFDTAVRAWLAAHRSPLGLAIFRTITWLGATVVLIPAALVFGVLLIRRGSRHAALVIGVAPIALGITVALVKTLLSIKRPDSPAAAHLGFSFPSGHTSASTAAAIIFTWIFVREGMAPRRIFPLGILMALLVGISRVYLDVHWASDVLGGWVIGGACGASTCLVYEWLRRTSSTTNTPAPPSE